MRHPGLQRLGSESSWGPGPESERAETPVRSFRQYKTSAFGVGSELGAEEPDLQTGCLDCVCHPSSGGPGAIEGRCPAAGENPRKQPVPTEICRPTYSFGPRNCEAFACSVRRRVVDGHSSHPAWVDS